MEYEYDDNFKTKYIIFFGLFLILGFIAMVTIGRLTDDSSDYTTITRETEVDGQMHDVERNRGAVFFKIADTLKFFFFFISGGDWIEKRKGSDTLFIRRPITVSRSEYFIFVLGQELNKEFDNGQTW